ncbi:hypothetical protein [Helicobacter marmotae]|nr:hypothetical protein [Helicobacter marmotae]
MPEEFLLESLVAHSNSSVGLTPSLRMTNFATACVTQTTQRQERLK